MKQIVLEHVTKSFTTKALGTVVAVDDFNLEIEKGECFSFLGPSGCGKTTTLRMIAGFEDLTKGSIYLGDKLVSDRDKNIYVPPEKRDLGMVFQAFAVWTHLNVFDNVAFPLKVKRLQKQFGFTIIFVTHDQAEAMALSDRILVMDMGRIQQIGTPQELYRHPVNRFVHSFLGQSNFTNVIIKEGRVYPTGDEKNAIYEDTFLQNSKAKVMATRPNSIELSKESGYPSTIVKRTFKTDFAEYLVKAGDETLLVQTPHRNIFNSGDRCFLRINNPAWYEPEGQKEKGERERRNTM